MHVADLLKGTAAEAAEFGLWALGRPGETDFDDRSALRALAREGVYVVPKFLGPPEIAELKTEVDRVTTGEGVWVDSVGSDHRLYGADRRSPRLKKFLEHQWINGIGRAHCRNEMKAGFTLAARMNYVPGNPGSGGGWHRDSPIRRQFKSILYLTDVSVENGPFEYVSCSHTNLSVLSLIAKGHQKYRQYRFTDTEVERILGDGGFAKRTFAGQAGDLILVDTKGIHRGCPMKSGSRYAITNYFFAKVIPPHMAKGL